MRDLLLANILHYLRPAAWPLSDLPALLAESFEALPERAKFESKTGAALLYKVLPKLAPRLQKLQVTLTRPAAEREFRSAQAIEVGSWLYNGKLGICALGHKYKGLDNLTLTLLHPGFQDSNDDFFAYYRYELLPQAKLLAL